MTVAAPSTRRVARLPGCAEDGSKDLGHGGDEDGAKCREADGDDADGELEEGEGGRVDVVPCRIRRLGGRSERPDAVNGYGTGAIGLVNMAREVKRQGTQLDLQDAKREDNQQHGLLPCGQV